MTPPINANLLKSIYANHKAEENNLHLKRDRERGRESRGKGEREMMSSTANILSPATY